MEGLRRVLHPTERLKRLEKAGTEFKLDRNIPIRRYYKSGSEMLRMANNHAKDGSLEKAYTLYHKYLSLFIEKVKKHPEYSHVSNEEKSRVVKNMKGVFAKCEELKTVLKISFTEEYENYLVQLEEARKEEEKLKQEMEETKMLEEAMKKDEERQNYHNEVEKNLAMARDRELAMWHHYQLNQQERPSAPPEPEAPEMPSRELKPAEVPPVPDRSTKPFSFMHDDGGLKTLIVPQEVIPMFLSVAEANTSVNIETCGILAGKLSRNTFKITHVIVPKQKGTPDSCTTEDEEDLIACQDKHDLITLGWIHTHPTQTAFLSSVDLHTHLPYQLMLPEAVAIVCAPKFNETGFFVLTPNYGLDFIGNCKETGFHPHPSEPPLFEEGSHVKLDQNASVEVVDLR